MTLFRHLRFIAISLTAWLVLACSSTPTINTSELKSEVEHPEYAKYFEIEKRDSCTIIRIFNPWQANKIKQELQVSTLANEGNNSIQCPIQSTIPLSTSFYGFIEALNQLQTVVAVENKNFVFNQYLNQEIQQGRVIEVGQSGTISIERTIELHPNVVITSGSELLSPNLTKIVQAGIPVLQNMDWQEQHPLGKAEWIKVFGVLYHQEALADSVFNAVKNQYEALVSSMQHNSSSEKPSVLLGYNYQGTWYLPGGKSYVAQYLRDAGYNYQYNTDTTTGSLGISAELIYNNLKSADYWFHPGSCKTLNDLLMLDKRYRFMDAFSMRKVYNNTLRMNKAGGNDFWETSPCNPHLVLADLIKIAYPHLLPNHKLYFYQQLQ